MREIQFNDTSAKAELGDVVNLQSQKQEVVACQETGVPMLNIDADQLKRGDLTFIKKLGLTISNPNTDKPVALGVDYVEESFGHKLANFFRSDESAEIPEDEEQPSPSREDDDDDSSFFSSGGLFGGGSSFGGGFGGFGGGGFGGGGASRGF